MRLPMGKDACRTWGAFCLLAGLFLLIQLSGIDYGTRLNDAPHIAGFDVDSDVRAESALERRTIPGAGAGESLDRWMVRYKLYSVEADEHLNIMALARIQPQAGQFDPHLYQYGGAWLYPLGAWYLVLSKLGVVPIADLPTLLAEPDRMDAVYVWGRVLVLISVVIAGGVLFDALRRMGGAGDASIATAVFFAVPATVMFSQVMKPHWYALLWMVLAIHQLVIGFQQRALPPAREGTIAVAVGLAVGSVLTNGLFAVGVWLALSAMVLRSWAPRWAVVRVPVVAVLVYVCSNPYVLLNPTAYLREGEMAAGWLDTLGGPGTVWKFIENSLLTGFGVAPFGLALAVAAWTIARPPTAFARWIAVYGLAVIIVIGVMTATLGHWHTNTRYAPYLLPAGLLLLLAQPWPQRRTILAVVLGLTLLQSAPLAIAYHDENDAARSTRHRTAGWIGDNVPAGSGLCFGTDTPAPFDVPPVDFRRYRINADDCDVLVIVDRQTDETRRPPAGFELAERFRPALSPAAFPTVIGHINPQVSIYRRQP